MFASLRARREPLLAVVLLAIVVALGWFAVIRPWQAWREATSREISETAGRIARFNAIVASGDGAGDKLRAGIEELYGPEFLRGESDAIILADLQSLIGGIISAHGCELALARQIPAQQVDGQTRLGLHLQIRGDIRRMFEVLHALETGKPFLFIENASLRLMDGAGIAAEEGAEVIQVVVELDIFGVRWPTGGGAGT